MTTERNKSGGKTDTRFKKGPDPRRGRGPAKGAPNAGRPPDALRAMMRESLALAVEKINAQLQSDTLTPEFLAKAAEVLSKHALPQQKEISGRDGAPIESEVTTKRQVLRFGDREIEF